MIRKTRFFYKAFVNTIDGNDAMNHQTLGESVLGAPCGAILSGVYLGRPRHRLVILIII